jgi:hypothetical protein
MPTASAVRQNNVFARRLDSLSAADLQKAHALYDSALVGALARTSTWGTWLGVFVAVLGVAVAVLTIFSAVYLWTQSSDFRRQRRKTLQDVDRRFRKIAETREKEWGDKVAAIDAWRADLERQILTVIPDPKAAGSGIEALRAEIERMKKFVVSESPRRVELGGANSRDDEGQRLAAITGGEFVGFLLHARFLSADDDHLPYALAAISDLINTKIIESGNYVVVTGVVPRGQARHVADQLSSSMKRPVTLVEPYPPYVPRE